MMSKNILEVLFIDDSESVITQMKDFLARNFAGREIEWTFCSQFEQAISLINYRRFDIVVTDIYRDRPGKKKSIEEGDIQAGEIIKLIRQKRFCPIVLYSDGKVPPDLLDDPFVTHVDKGGVPEDLELAVKGHIATGLPDIIRNLHDEIDRGTGSYIWDYLSKNWKDHFSNSKMDVAKLRTVIARRTAIQLHKQDELAGKIVNASGVDYYFIPPISEKFVLGSLLKTKARDGEYRIVLTPHCHLEKQPNQDAPRAEMVLTVVGEKAVTIAKDLKWTKQQDVDRLPKRTRIPALSVRKPEGRDCFFPGFAEIPDLYFDLMHIESIKYARLTNDFIHVADITSPYAEALQTALTNYYSSVGLPNLDPNDYLHLVHKNDDAKKS
jgi:hypothetical protein